jgi:hypothetical protein
MHRFVGYLQTGVSFRRIKMPPRRNDFNPVNADCAKLLHAKEVLVVKKSVKTDEDRISLYEIIRSRLATSGVNCDTKKQRCEAREMERHVFLLGDGIVLNVWREKNDNNEYVYSYVKKKWICVIKRDATYEWKWRWSTEMECVLRIIEQAEHTADTGVHPRISETKYMKISVGKDQSLLECTIDALLHKRAIRFKKKKWNDGNVAMKEYKLLKGVTFVAIDGKPAKCRWVGKMAHLLPLIQECSEIYNERVRDEYELK